MTFMDGTWRVHQELQGSRCGTCRWDGSGTYTVAGGRITLTFKDDPACFGCTLSANWSVGPTTLSMRDFSASVPDRFEPGVDFLATWQLVLGSRPLTQVT